MIPNSSVSSVKKNKPAQAKLPTADGAIILVTPNSLNAQIFALKLFR